MERLTLNRRPKTGDKVKCLPAGDGLPIWSTIPLDAKLPMMKNPKGSVTLFTTKLGQPKHKCKQEIDFDLRDPNGQYICNEYQPLHDPHLKAHFNTQVMRRHLIKKGFISEDGKVLCSLREFNQYRQYLRHVFFLEIAKERREELDKIHKRASDQKCHDAEGSMSRGTIVRQRIQQQREEAKHRINNDILIKKDRFERRLKEIREEMAKQERKRRQEAERRQQRVDRNQHETDQRNLMLIKNWRQQDRLRSKLMEDREIQQKLQADMKCIAKWNERKNVQRKMLAKDEAIMRKNEEERQQNICQREKFISRQRNTLECKLEKQKQQMRDEKVKRDQRCARRFEEKIASGDYKIWTKRKDKRRCRRKTFCSTWKLKDILSNLTMTDTQKEPGGTSLMAMINKAFDAPEDIIGEGEGFEELQAKAHEMVQDVLSRVTNYIYPDCLKMLEEDEVEAAVKSRSVRFCTDDDRIGKELSPDHESEEEPIDSDYGCMRPVSEHILTPCASQLEIQKLEAEAILGSPEIGDKMTSVSFVETLLLRLLDDLNGGRLSNDDIMKLASYSLGILQSAELKDGTILEAPEEMDTDGPYTASSSSSSIAKKMVDFTLGKILYDIQTGNVHPDDLASLTVSLLDNTSPSVESSTSISLSDADLGTCIDETLRAATSTAIDPREDSPVCGALLDDSMVNTLKNSADPREDSPLCEALLDDFIVSTIKNAMDPRKDSYECEALLDDFVTDTLKNATDCREDSLVGEAPLDDSMVDTLKNAMDSREDSPVCVALLDNFMVTTLKNLINDLQNEVLSKSQIEALATSVKEETKNVLPVESEEDLRDSKALQKALTELLQQLQDKKIDIQTMYQIVFAVVYSYNAIKAPSTPCFENRITTLMRDLLKTAEQKAVAGKIDDVNISIVHEANQRLLQTNLDVSQIERISSSIISTVSKPEVVCRTTTSDIARAIVEDALKKATQQLENERIDTNFTQGVQNVAEAVIVTTADIGNTEWSASFPMGDSLVQVLKNLRSAIKDSEVIEPADLEDIDAIIAQISANNIDSGQVEEMAVSIARVLKSPVKSESSKSECFIVADVLRKLEEDLQRGSLEDSILKEMLNIVTTSFRVAQAADVHSPSMWNALSSFLKTVLCFVSNKVQSGEFSESDIQELSKAMKDNVNQNKCLLGLKESVFDAMSEPSYTLEHEQESQIFDKDIEIGSKVEENEQLHKEEDVGKVETEQLTTEEEVENVLQYFQTLLDKIDAGQVSPHMMGSLGKRLISCGRSLLENTSGYPSALFTPDSDVIADDVVEEVIRMLQLEITNGTLKQDTFKEITKTIISSNSSLSMIAEELVGHTINKIHRDVERGHEPSKLSSVPSLENSTSACTFASHIILQTIDVIQTDLSHAMFDENLIISIASSVISMINDDSEKIDDIPRELERVKPTILAIIKCLKTDSINRSDAERIFCIILENYKQVVAGKNTSMESLSEEGRALVNDIVTETLQNIEKSVHKGRTYTKEFSIPSLPTSEETLLSDEGRAQVNDIVTEVLQNIERSVHKGRMYTKEFSIPSLPTSEETLLSEEGRAHLNDIVTEILKNIERRVQKGRMYTKDFSIPSLVTSEDISLSVEDRTLINDIVTETLQNIERRVDKGKECTKEFSVPSLPTSEDTSLSHEGRALVNDLATETLQYIERSVHKGEVYTKEFSISSLPTSRDTSVAVEELVTLCLETIKKTSDEKAMSYHCRYTDISDFILDVVAKLQFELSEGTISNLSMAQFFQGISDDPSDLKTLEAKATENLSNVIEDIQINRNKSIYIHRILETYLSTELAQDSLFSDPVQAVESILISVSSDILTKFVKATLQNVLIEMREGCFNLVEKPPSVFAIQSASSLIAENVIQEVVARIKEDMIKSVDRIHGVVSKQDFQRAASKLLCESPMKAVRSPSEDLEKRKNTPNQSRASVRSKDIEDIVLETLHNIVSNLQFEQSIQSQKIIKNKDDQDLNILSKIQDFVLNTLQNIVTDLQDRRSQMELGIQGTQSKYGSSNELVSIESREATAYVNEVLQTVLNDMKQELATIYLEKASSDKTEPDFMNLEAFIVECLQNATKDCHTRNDIITLEPDQRSDVKQIINESILATMKYVRENRLSYEDLQTVYDAQNKFLAEPSVEVNKQGLQEKVSESLQKVLVKVNDMGVDESTLNRIATQVATLGMDSATMERKSPEYLDKRKSSSNQSRASFSSKDIDDIVLETLHNIVSNLQTEQSIQPYKIVKNKDDQASDISSEIHNFVRNTLQNIVTDLQDGKMQMELGIPRTKSKYSSSIELVSGESREASAYINEVLQTVLNDTKQELATKYLETTNSDEIDPDSMNLDAFIFECLQNATKDYHTRNGDLEKEKTSSNQSRASVCSKDIDDIVSETLHNIVFNLRSEQSVQSHKIIKNNNGQATDLSSEVHDFVRNTLQNIVTDLQEGRSQMELGIQRTQSKYGSSIELVSGESREAAAYVNEVLQTVLNGTKQEYLEKTSSEETDFDSMDLEAFILQCLQNATKDCHTRNGDLEKRKSSSNQSRASVGSTDIEDSVLETLHNIVSNLQSEQRSKQSQKIIKNKDGQVTDLSSEIHDFVLNTLQNIVTDLQDGKSQMEFGIPRTQSKYGSSIELVSGESREASAYVNEVLQTVLNDTKQELATRYLEKTSSDETDSDSMNLEAFILECLQNATKDCHSRHGDLEKRKSSSNQIGSKDIEDFVLETLHTIISNLRYEQSIHYHKTIQNQEDQASDILSEIQDFVLNTLQNIVTDLQDGRMPIEFGIPRAQSKYGSSIEIVSGESREATTYVNEVLQIVLNDMKQELATRYLEKKSTDETDSDDMNLEAFILECLQSATKDCHTRSGDLEKGKSSSNQSRASVCSEDIEDIVLETLHNVVSNLRSEQSVQSQKIIKNKDGQATDLSSEIHDFVLKTLQNIVTDLQDGRSQMEFGNQRAQCKYGSTIELVSGESTEAAAYVNEVLQTVLDDTKQELATRYMVNTSSDETDSDSTNLEAFILECLQNATKDCHTRSGDLDKGKNSSNQSRASVRSKDIEDSVLETLNNIVSNLRFEQSMQSHKIIKNKDHQATDISSDIQNFVMNSLQNIVTDIQDGRSQMDLGIPRTQSQYGSSIELVSGESREYAAYVNEVLQTVLNDTKQELAIRYLEKTSFDESDSDCMNLEAFILECIQNATKDCHTRNDDLERRKSSSNQSSVSIRSKDIEDNVLETLNNIVSNIRFEQSMQSHKIIKNKDDQATDISSDIQDFVLNSLQNIVTDIQDGRSQMDLGIPRTQSKYGSSIELVSGESREYAAYVNEVLQTVLNDTKQELAKRHLEKTSSDETDSDCMNLEAFILECLQNPSKDCHTRKDVITLEPDQPRDVKQIISERILAIMKNVRENRLSYEDLQTVYDVLIKFLEEPLGAINEQDLQEKVVESLQKLLVKVKDMEIDESILSHIASQVAKLGMDSATMERKSSEHLGKGKTSPNRNRAYVCSKDIEDTVLETLNNIVSNLQSEQSIHSHKIIKNNDDQVSDISSEIQDFVRNTLQNIVTDLQEGKSLMELGIPRTQSQYGSSIELVSGESREATAYVNEVLQTVINDTKQELATIYLEKTSNDTTDSDSMNLEAFILKCLQDATKDCHTRNDVMTLEQDQPRNVKHIVNESILATMINVRENRLSYEDLQTVYDALIKFLEEPQGEVKEQDVQEKVVEFLQKVLVKVEDMDVDESTLNRLATQVATLGMDSATMDRNSSDHTVSDSSVSSSLISELVKDVLLKMSEQIEPESNQAHQIATKADVNEQGTPDEMNINFNRKESTSSSRTDSTSETKHRGCSKSAKKLNTGNKKERQNPVIKTSTNSLYKQNASNIAVSPKQERQGKTKPLSPLPRKPNKDSKQTKMFPTTNPEVTDCKRLLATKLSKYERFPKTEVSKSPSQGSSSVVNDQQRPCQKSSKKKDTQHGEPKQIVEDPSVIKSLCGAHKSKICIRKDQS